MANERISGLDELTSVDGANDKIPIVDASDTTMASTGTTKYVLPNSLPVSTAQAAAIAVVQSDINTHEANTSNPHSVTKAQVGLSNVDNTSDVNKPVSTATQTALDTKVDKNLTWTQQTDNYTLALSDKDKAIDLDKSTAVNLTVPPSSSVNFPAGAQIIIRQSGAGQVTFVPGSGVTIQSYNSRNKTTGQWAMVTLIKRDSLDDWALEGNLTT